MGVGSWATLSRPIVRIHKTTIYNKHFVMTQQGENNQGDGSHIDNIIGRLREVRDGGVVSEERSRDIIERSDGSRVVKVRRRRRVYQDERKKLEPKGADFKKWILIMGMSGVVVCIAAIAFLMVRISSFNSEEFVKNKTEELSKAWNAHVEIKGVSFEGLGFSAHTLVAQFPDDSLIKEVALQGVSGDLIPVSFITGIFQGDTMSVNSAKVVLRNNVSKVKFPSFTGKALWNYSRYRVNQFDVEFEDAKDAPFRLSSELYVRRSAEGGRYNCNLNSRTLSIKGWQTIALNVASIYVTDQGLEYIDINGTMSETASVSITGQFKEGADLFAPSLTVTGVNIPLASITANRFTPLLSAEFGSPSELQEAKTSFKFALPTDKQAFPPFSGESKDIKNILLRGLPILKELSDVTGNKGYLNPRIGWGKAMILSDGNGIVISQLDASEYSFLSLKGTINVSGNKDLSGQLSLGVPSRAAMSSDTVVDPLFVRDDGEVAWVDVSLAGTLAKPMDNTSHLVDAVQSVRSKVAQERGLLLNPEKLDSEQRPRSDDSGGEESSDEQEFKSLLR